jgi:CubicO group peptidase (beta-lactamase class C family)
VERQVQRRIEEAVSAGFSGSVLVKLRGKTIVARGYGLADRESNVTNTENTAFDAGSIMKNLTATAVFKLDEQGVLSVNDTLSELLPGVPADKADITLLQVMQHSAGFDEYHDTSGDFEPMTELEARQRIFAQELLFPPGTDAAYSNSGYTLLADVVQARSGQPFTDYVRRALFEPAGMDHSGFYPDAIWQRVDTAIGYGAETFGDNDPASWPYTWSLVGNGGLVSTVVDLERWSSALWSGRIVSSETLARMQAEYLAGGAVEIAGATAYLSAGAGDYGLGAAVVDVPEQDTRVIVATNTFDDFDIEDFVLELATELLEREPHDL